METEAAQQQYEDNGYDVNRFDDDSSGASGASTPPVDDYDYHAGWKEAVAAIRAEEEAEAARQTGARQDRPWHPKPASGPKGTGAPEGSGATGGRANASPSGSRPGGQAAFGQSPNNAPNKALSAPRTESSQSRGADLDSRQAGMTKNQAETSRTNDMPEYEAFQNRQHPIYRMVEGMLLKDPEYADFADEAKGYPDIHRALMKHAMVHQSRMEEMIAAFEPMYIMWLQDQARKPGEPQAPQAPQAPRQAPQAPRQATPPMRQPAQASRQAPYQTLQAAPANSRSASSAPYGVSPSGRVYTAADFDYHAGWLEAMAEMAERGEI